MMAMMKHVKFIGSDVLTAVVMKSSFFWDITLCSPLKVNRRFGLYSMINSVSVYFKILVRF
jgi:hypothetical protein